MSLGGGGSYLGLNLVERIVSAIIRVGAFEIIFGRKKIIR